MGREWSKISLGSQHYGEQRWGAHGFFPQEKGDPNGTCLYNSTIIYNIHSSRLNYRDLLCSTTRLHEAKNIGRVAATSDRQGRALRPATSTAPDSDEEPIWGCNGDKGARVGDNGRGGRVVGE